MNMNHTNIAWCQRCFDSTLAPWLSFLIFLLPWLAMLTSSTCMGIHSPTRIGSWIQASVEIPCEGRPSSLSLTNNKNDQRMYSVCFSHKRSITIKTTLFVFNHCLKTNTQSSWQWSTQFHEICVKPMCLSRIPHLLMDGQSWRMFRVTKTRCQKWILRELHVAQIHLRFLVNPKTVQPGNKKTQKADEWKNHTYRLNKKTVTTDKLQQPTVTKQNPQPPPPKKKNTHFNTHPWEFQKKTVWDTEKIPTCEAGAVGGWSGRWTLKSGLGRRIKSILGWKPPKWSHVLWHMFMKE